MQNTLRFVGTRCQRGMMWKYLIKQLSTTKSWREIRFCFTKCVRVNRSQNASDYARSQRKMDIQPFQIKTNVPNNVLLYSYDKSGFITIVSIFGLTQLFFWSVMAEFAYKKFKEIPVQKYDDSVAWWRKINFGGNKFRYSFLFVSIFFGGVIVFITCLYPLRTVAQIWLLQGGEMIKLVTYAPFAMKRSLTIPLENVSCNQARNAPGTHIYMKIKNRPLYFYLDKTSGKFYDGQLFDYTAGMKRALKK
ncbi:hypothetical protein CHS0354_042549 [Potamilus streckersoni]|uniref:Transmembrane protein 223 n=1 Tax=Potamilus streckersoni TaxID=2493646 RepID=A0AAE0WBX6_9BIVA|nr:hypothetical protein CHS0354_042549 [Potamilus streckersoni]